MSTQTVKEAAPQIRTAAAVNQKLEVVVIPVADVDRAKRFYEGLGWRVDADFASGDDWRLVQVTPPGSLCSAMFGKGFTTAAPGSDTGSGEDRLEDVPRRRQPRNRARRAHQTRRQRERGVPLRGQSPCRRRQRAYDGPRP